MRAKRKVLKIIFILSIYVLLMTGCNEGAQIDTTLSLNADLSGVRVMEVTISDSLEEGELLATMEELQGLIAQICPSALSWGYSDASEMDVFTFQLTFSGKEDYEEKLSSLLGEETTITLEAPTSVWASGIQINENFSSAQLLEWLSAGLVDAEYVAAENISKIFKISNTSVEYQGEVYSSNQYISTNQMKYISLSRIHIDTKIIRKGVYERTVTFEIPNNSMEGNSDKITAYLEGLVPSAATSEWGEYDGGTTFEVVGRELTDATISTFTSSVLDTSEVIFQCTQETSDTYFDFADTIEEELDMTSFISNNHGVRLYYTVTAEGSIIANSQNYWYSTTSVDNPTIIIIDGMVDREMAIFNLTQVYPVQAVEVHASSISAKGAQIETTITVEGIPTEEEQATILARFQERAKYQDVSSDGETLYLYEVTTDTDANTYVVILDQEYQSESEEVANTANLAFENLPIYTDIRYEEESSLTDLKTFNTIDISARLGNLASLYSDDFLFTYELNAGLLNTIEKIDTNGYGDFVSVSQYKTSESEKAIHDISRNKYVFTSDVPTVNMNVALECSKLDIITILLYIVVVIVVIIFIKIKGKKKALAVATMPQQVVDGTMSQGTNGQVLQQAQPEMSETVQESPKVTIFCESCGAKLESGSKFCESCGSKVE